MKNAMTSTEALTEAVQQAARSLPADYEIQIVIERGHWFVQLIEPLGTTYSPDNRGAGMTLTEQVQDCVHVALERVKK